MRLTIIGIFSLFMIWTVTVVRFKCTNLDVEACTELCHKNNKEFRQVRMGLIRDCLCSTNWLKKEREREFIRQQRMQPLQP